MSERTLTRDWTGYFERVLAPFVEDDPQTFKLARNCFFAGAAAALSMIAESKDSAAYLRRMEALLAELEKYTRDRT